MPVHYNWVPACGGAEKPFEGWDGKIYILMWNNIPATNPPAGHQCEHAYYCVTDDLFLADEELSGRVYRPDL